MTVTAPAVAATVKLSKPVRGHRGEITELRFREPTFNDYAELGNPRVPMVANDVLFFQTIPNVVRSYADRLLLDDDPNFIGACGVADALVIEETILSFFQKAKTETAASSSPTSSSSPLDNPLDPLAP